MWFGMGEGGVWEGWWKGLVGRVVVKSCACKKVTLLWRVVWPQKMHMSIWLNGMHACALNQFLYFCKPAACTLKVVEFWPTFFDNLRRHGVSEDGSNRAYYIEGLPCLLFCWTFQAKLGNSWWKLTVIAFVKGLNFGTSLPNHCTGWRPTHEIAFHQCAACFFV